MKRQTTVHNWLPGVYYHFTQLIAWCLLSFHRFGVPLNQVHPPFFFLKFYVPNQKYGSCYQIVRFYVCWCLFLLHFGVPVVPLFTSDSWYVSLGFGLSIKIGVECIYLEHDSNTQPRCWQVFDTVVWRLRSLVHRCTKEYTKHDILKVKTKQHRSLRILRNSQCSEVRLTDPTQHVVSDVLLTAHSRNRGRGSGYNNWNISSGICETDIL